MLFVNNGINLPFAIKLLIIPQNTISRINVILQTHTTTKNQMFLIQIINY